MGILETILENQDKIIAMLEDMNAPAGAAKESKKAEPKKAETKKAETKKAETKKADKDEDTTPDCTADDVRNAFLAVQEKHGDDVAKGLIQELGYKKLAEIIGDTENWQKSLDAAKEKLDEEADDESDEDNGGL